MRSFLLACTSAFCGGVGALCVLHDASLPLTFALAVAPDDDAEIGGLADGSAPVAVVDEAPTADEPQAPKSAEWVDPALRRAWDQAAAAGQQWVGSARDGVPALFASKSAPARAPAKTSAVIGSRTPSGWVVVAQSAEGRPLHVRRIGSGKLRTLVVAGLDGEDRIAVNWVDQYVQQLSQTTDALENYELAFLRAANPDGLTVKHHENSRGVSLNRNFPTPGFRPGGDPSAGQGPASEVETRAVLQLLYDLKPQRVVHLVASAGKSSVVCNSAAANAARTLSEGLRIETQPFDPRQCPGSLEEFAATVLGAEVLTVRLSVGDDWRSAAVAHFPALVAATIPEAHRGAAIAAKVPAAPQSPAGSTPTAAADRDDAPVSASEAVNVSHPRRSGYKELPAPPEGE